MAPISLKPLSISRLALLYLALSAVLLLAIATYFWREIEETTHQLHLHETQAAKSELAEAIGDVRKRMTEISSALANWDETKQQLVFPEYYTLWRDNRVRDVGIVPPTVDSVALYDKAGNILMNSDSPDPMPLKLPGSPPLTLFRRDAGHDHLYQYTPVFADPAKGVLLGYLGLKFDLVVELTHARAYRYADMATLRVSMDPNSAVDASSALEYLQVQAQPNPELLEFQRLLENSLTRLALALLLTLALAALLVNRLVVRPLRRLSEEIDTMRDAGVDITAQRLESLPVLELENVRRSFNDYQARLADLHQDLEQTSQDFFDQARHDALTGAFNRRAFDEDWREGILDRRLDNMALILFDCDHFKAINDTYGHNVGDAVIQAIAACLQQALRADDRLYRLGGDEFATLITDTDARHAQSVAERCLEHIFAHDFRQHGLSEPVTISIGVAVSDDGLGKGQRITLTELQKRADLAMYAAKRPGGQKIVFYTPDIGSVESLVANRSINAVFRAIQDPDLIEIAYQAVVRLPGIEQEYSEALTRIRFEGQLIFPGDIFPIIQDRNLDAEFDMAIIRAINRDMDTETLPPGKGVSINISAQGIVNAKVVDAMVALLEAEQRRKIVVEITETALITQMETATANIQRLRSVGALVALDDFGSGYSSLRYLASMPVDLVKFDISMVRMLESGNARQQLMIEEIARMVIAAGYDLVAEGIESQTLLDKVVRLGFSHGQGYLFGKPGEYGSGGGRALPGSGPDLQVRAALLESFTSPGS
ncbi:MAG: EAL domain-containing protein [Thiobacillus sp.]|nr:EAL domain-containing protein [Thiobacillus sp.]